MPRRFSVLDHGLVPLGQRLFLFRPVGAVEPIAEQDQKTDQEQKAGNQHPGQEDALLRRGGLGAAGGGLVIAEAGEDGEESSSPVNLKARQSSRRLQNQVSREGVEAF